MIKKKPAKKTAHRFTVNLSQDLADFIQAENKRTGANAAQVVREALMKLRGAK